MSTTTTTRKTNLKNIMNFIAYIAIVFIGVALIISYIFKSNQGAISQALNTISQILSYLLVAYYSFGYVKGKRNWVHILVWSIAVALIILSLVLTGL